MRYLSLCCIVRDETPFLREFVEFHALVGVEHFYIYDHCSRISAARTLKDHVKTGLVTVIDCGPEWTQLGAYTDCLKRYGRTTRWMAFIDADEVLVPKNDNDLRPLLTEYEDFGGLAVSWVMFGSSGRLKRPEGGQIANYTESFALDSVVNRHIKSIVQPRYTVKPLSTHNFEHVPDRYLVNENRFPVSGPFSPHSVNRIQCNHYYFRSEQDFCEKRERGEMNVSGSGKLPDKYSLDHFINQASEPVKKDRAALRFWPKYQELSAQNNAEAFKSISREGCDETMDEFFRRALENIESGCISEALHILGMACVRLGDDSVLWRTRGSLLRKAGRLSEALEALKRSIRVQATPEAFRELVQVQIDLGMESEARNTLTYFKNRLQTDWAYFAR